MSTLKEQFNELKMEIEEQKANQSPVIAIESQSKPPTNNESIKVDNLVGDLINTAIISEIQNNNETKEKVIETAKTIVNTKVDTVKIQANTDNNKANFDNKKEACACFGFSEKEDTLPKKAVDAMNVIHNFWLAIWIGLCAITLCPINFVAKRMQNTIKKTWITIVIALLIYLSIIIGLPTLIVNLVK